MVETNIDSWDIESWCPSEEYIEEITEETLKKMQIEDIKPAIQRKIAEMKDLFDMNEDALIKIARYFRWNDELMETKWFENKSTLEL